MSARHDAREHRTSITLAPSGAVERLFRIFGLPDWAD
jgi:hypothetical protein